MACSVSGGALILRRASRTLWRRLYKVCRSSSVTSSGMNTSFSRLAGYHARLPYLFGLRSGKRHASAPALHRSSTNRRSEEHTSELQSLMRISYAVFCLKKKKKKQLKHRNTYSQNTQSSYTENKQYNKHNN